MNPITQLCRDLRNNATPSERRLWKELKIRNMGGEKFLRQFPIFVSSSFGRKSFYIADFYCARLKLVIEVDRPIHLLKKDYDANRDLVMSELGFNILRFTNQQVVSNLNEVVEKIIFCDSIAYPTPPPLILGKN